MSLPEAFLNEIRSRISVSSIVGRRVKLSRQGREWAGCCPFHNEKTPSFTVSDDKEFWHCFGCSKHGDVIDFVKLSEGLTFIEAVEQLAGAAGLDMPRATEEDRERDQRILSLQDALERACAWYEEQLAGAGGAPGRDYLAGRGLTAETVARFRLGFAPPGRSVARALGISPEAAIELGLARRGDDGVVRDLFRNRVTFPITDRRGRVIGFGARALGDEKPKYLNSPETALFHKGASLFGVSHARNAAADCGQTLVVEGYMDVIALHQGGIEFAVAPLGTSITELQLDLAWRLAPVCILALDGDTAGQRAMERATERALPMVAPGRELRFMRLPASHDPDTLIRKRGATPMRALINKARPLTEAVWSIAARRHSSSSPEGIAAFERGLFTFASLVADDGVRRALINEFRCRLADEIGTPLPTILRGRSTKNAAPKPGGDMVGLIWGQALAANAHLQPWLMKHGVDWNGLVAQLGGVGFARARVMKGKYPPGRGWADAPSLWEPNMGDVGLVILPDWPRGPNPDDNPADLIGWNPHTGELSVLTGAAYHLGADLVAEAWGFESRGLSRPVSVSASPMSWLKRLSKGDRSVLLVDWSRAWDAFGGVPTLAAETVDLGDRLEKAVRPPRMQGPKIMVNEGVI